MKAHDRVRLLGLPVFALTLCVGASLAPAAESPADIVPANTVVYVGIPSFDTVREAFGRTAAGQMLDDPTVKDAIKPYVGTARKLQELIAKRLGLDSPSDLEQLPKGAVAGFLTLSAPKSEGEDPDLQAGLVADFGENVASAQRVIEALIAKCVEQGARRETLDGPGGELTHVTYKQAEDVEEPSTNDEEPRSEFADEVIGILTAEELGLDDMTRMMIREMLADLQPPEEFAVAVKDSRILLGTSPVVVRESLRLLRDGNEESFAKSSSMRLLERRFPEPAHVQVAVEVPRMVEVMAQSDPDDARLVKALALDAVGPAVMVQNLAPQPGLDSVAHGFWEIRDRTRGLGRMLMLSNQRTAPPAMFEADTLMYFLAHVDIPTIVDEVIEVTGRMDPAEAENMRAGMKHTLPDGSTLDVRQDILAHLKGPAFGYLRATAPFGPADCNALLGMNISSRSAVEKVLGLLPADTFNTREVRGGMVYEFPMIPIFGVAAGLSDRTWMMGTLGAIEGQLRAEGRETSPLAEDLQVQRLLRLLPEEACAVMFVDGRRLFDAQVAILRAGAGTQPQPFGSQAGAWIQWWMRQNFVGESLPDPSVLAKYQDVQMVTVTTESDGLRLEGVAVTVGATD